MTRPARRVILVIGTDAPYPHLPPSLTIIDRRTASRPARRPGEVAHQVVELLVAGACLPDVPECERPQEWTVEDLNRAAAHYTPSPGELR